MTGELLRFRHVSQAVPAARATSAAENALSRPVSERAEHWIELSLDDPELLLAATDILRARLASEPSTARDDAEFFYRFLDERTLPVGLFDEDEYFRGEFALIAATACRLLFRREEGHRWLARAEAAFALTVSADVHACRLAYQRLALKTEERQYEEVLELAPKWSESASRLTLVGEELKFRFLQGAVLRELDRVDEAIAVFQELSSRCRRLRKPELEAQAENNLVECVRAKGDLPAAMEHAQKALSLFGAVGNRVHLPKLRWFVGDILREQGKLSDAIAAYRVAKRECEEVGLRGDLAAIHLVLADSLLESGLDAQAEWEVRAALPIIDEEQMVPEGFAALSLLRESLRRRKLDRNALRTLHGYFKE